MWKNRALAASWISFQIFQNVMKKDGLLCKLNIIPPPGLVTNRVKKEFILEKFLQTMIGQIFSLCQCFSSTLITFYLKWFSVALRCGFRTMESISKNRILLWFWTNCTFLRSKSQIILVERFSWKFWEMGGSFH